MEHFAWHDPSDIFGVNSDQRDRRAPAVDKFHLVCGTVLVNVNYSADVAAMKFLVTRVTIKYNK
jgi:hypothetical protein